MNNYEFTLRETTAEWEIRAVNVQDPLISLEIQNNIQMSRCIFIIYSPWFAEYYLYSNKIIELLDHILQISRLQLNILKLKSLIVKIT